MNVVTDKFKAMTVKVNYYHCIEVITICAFPVIQIVGSVVFAAGSNFKSVRVTIIPLLQASDVASSVLAGKQRVLSGSLLTSPPSWVSENVDIGRPIG